MQHTRERSGSSVGDYVLEATWPWPWRHWCVPSRHEGCCELYTITSHHSEALFTFHAN